MFSVENASVLFKPDDHEATEIEVWLSDEKGGVLVHSANPQSMRRRHFYEDSFLKEMCCFHGYGCCFSAD